MEILILALGLTTIFVVIDFINFLSVGERKFNGRLMRVAEVISVVLGPLIFLGTFDHEKINDCCSESAFFSPDHRPTMYVLIAICSVVYFICSYRKGLSAPALEILFNCILLIGFALNLFVAIHTKEFMFWSFGNISIGCLFLMTLGKNHQLIISETSLWDIDNRSGLNKVIIKLLNLSWFIKYPVLLVLCLPVLLLLAVLLFVFGQKPDSSIKAFTETYKHGLSQLDYMCDNVQCGGHYLCSVAANGHKTIVRPQRLGERNGGRIICNRQLLVSNAFEELIEQRLPILHRFIRQKYDKVGDMVHRHYHVFNNKFFSDIIYVLMKPLEWFFLVTLYLFDKRPENRIAQQYLARQARKAISDRQKNIFLY